MGWDFTASPDTAGIFDMEMDMDIDDREIKPDVFWWRRGTGGAEPPDVGIAAN